MGKSVTLDAMIPREDFAYEDQEFVLDLFQGLPISYLTQESPILKLLRKPDFQRETNHWVPEQIATFIASFLDNEIIPGLILWKSPSFVFVIDGGHRLSALRAWIEDDYGDKSVSHAFYGGEISDHQRNIARKTRRLVEQRVGRFSDLMKIVGDKSAQEQPKRRANLLVTRTIPVQWIQGSASVAETSFFKINSQGTPLDETESMLIRNRKKPVAIAARAILRAGTGHKYWSAFSESFSKRLEELASEVYSSLFEPEVQEPLKTLDVPIGGTVSPVDALSLLIDFVLICSENSDTYKTIESYVDDPDGRETIQILERVVGVIRRITGNSPASLGLHPAVYFYNDRGKYSKFMFLAIAMLFAERIKNNDDGFFRVFTKARKDLERFLRSNKSLLGIVLQNMGKTQRVPKLRDLFVFLVREFNAGRPVEPMEAVAHLGLQGRIIDVVAKQRAPDFSDSTKSMIFIQKALEHAILCPICNGVMDPAKAVSYDHVTPRRDGGTGEPENCQMTHPYCNSARDSL